MIAQAQRGRWEDGCTAVTALLLGSHLVIGNLGDSRAVLCSGGKAVCLSVDHKPSDPRESTRIRAAGGRIVNVMGVLRLAAPGDGYMGGLSLCRAFGDIRYKKPRPLPPPLSPTRASRAPARAFSPVHSPSRDPNRSPGFAIRTAGGSSLPSSFSNVGRVDDLFTANPSLVPIAASSAEEGALEGGGVQSGPPPPALPVLAEDSPLSSCPDVRNTCLA